jgi:xylose isomerase
MRFAMEPKPNEPRGDTFLPTVGHALAFINTLQHPEMVGLNPETAHETMSGLSFYHAVGQALWHGKLFHIDLNGQKIGRYDQDLRFGSEDLKDSFFLVKLLEESGYEGARHFDAHAYRNEDADGVWDFAAGCMRTYLILREKARQFAADPEIAAALKEASATELAEPTVGRYSPEAAAALASAPGDPNVLAGRGYRNERLDQLVMELLMGTRGA